MAEYNKFIAENTAIKGANRIGIYNSKGNRAGYIPLGNLSVPALGEKKYSFGAVSDVHLQYDTAQEDFAKALTYFNEQEDVDFTCVCGDLTVGGTTAEFKTYVDYINTYSSDTPVYECTGNHDCYNTLLTIDSMKQYTGHDLYYSFTKNDDVFIMFGMQYADFSGGQQEPFSNEALQWLYETLEANRNKRCIVFQHCMRFDGSGKPYSKNMTGDLLNNTQGAVFKSLMEHYKNVIWFHGHSHMKFDCQEDCSYANYDRMFGCHSVHIPSLSVPRDYANDEYVYMYSQSEGYVVDVYENGIHLQGRDFVKEKFLPIANYWINTSITEIEAGKFKDENGIITT